MQMDLEIPTMEHHADLEDPKLSKSLKDSEKHNKENKPQENRQYNSMLYKCI